MSLCILVCVCNPLKEHVVANSALYVVTVNGSDPILGRNRILDVLGRKPKPKMLCNNYLFY